MKSGSFPGKKRGDTGFLWPYSLAHHLCGKAPMDQSHAALQEHSGIKALHPGGAMGFPQNTSLVSLESGDTKTY